MGGAARASRHIGRDTRYRAVWMIMSLLVGRVYFWIAQRGQQPFDWEHDSNQYYDLLARGLLHGHLYLPVEPRPELLALKDPWDPRQNRQYALFDAVLYKGRYYLYHGVAPAVVYFAPWRLLTRHDLPGNFAVCYVACSPGSSRRSFSLRCCQVSELPYPCGCSRCF
jgi:hypothetical protein